MVWLDGFRNHHIVRWVRSIAFLHFPTCRPPHPLPRQVQKGIKFVSLYFPFKSTFILVLKPVRASTSQF